MAKQYREAKAIMILQNEIFVNLGSVWVNARFSNEF